MRQIGKLSSENHAARFVDYLLTQGIHSKADASSQGEWSIWIHEENQVDQARTELEAFRSNPDDSRYRSAGEEAAGIRKMEQLREKERRKNVHEVKHRSVRGGTGLSGAPVTKAIMIICVVIALIGMTTSNYSMKEPGFGDQIYGALSFLSPQDLQAYRVSPEPNSLRTIEKGEIWRLITPAFLHARDGSMAILHVGFNMYMLFMLGPILERRLGSFQFLILNLTLALAGNLAQGVLPMLFIDLSAVLNIDITQYERFYGGVNFLGYSGVVYGLFGYLWMRSNNDPTFGIMINQSSVIILMMWFLLCWIGFMGDIANLAHTGGLVVGMLAGYIQASVRR